MTVNTLNITSGPYTGNGLSDTFSYSFRVNDKTQLSVFETDDVGVQTLLVVDTDYTVNNVGVDSGGTIVRLAGNLPTDYIWFIRSNYIENQLTDFSSQGPFFPKIHEAQFDHLTFLIQQLRDNNDRQFSLSESIDIDGDLTISDVAAVRSGKFLSFDVSGDLVVSSGPQTLTGDVIYDNVALMKAASPVTGLSVSTRGYYTAGDGGHANYLTVTPQAFNGFSDHELANNNIAVLQTTLGVVTSAQFGTKSDGVTDDTARLNSFLLLGGAIHITDGVYAVSDSLDLISNTHLIFHPGVEILFIIGSSVTTGDGMLNMNELDNITITGNGALLTGERKGSGTSDIVMGLRITGCTNVRANNLIVEDMAGDGVYVAGANDNTPIFSDGVWLNDIKCNNNMRNGLSVVSVKNCWVDGWIVTNSNGKDPETGYDFEVEGTTTLMQNVNVTNCIGTNNKQFDFALVLGGNTTPITNSVGIILDNCMSADSTTYVETIGLGIINHKDTMANDGFVKINNFTARNVNNHGLFIRNIDKDGQALELTNITLIDTALTDLVNLISGSDSPFMLYTNSASSVYEDPGNVSITGLRIVDNTRDRTPYYISSAGNAWTNIKITDLDWVNTVGKTSFPYTDNRDDAQIRWLGEPYTVDRTLFITVSQRYSGWRLTNLGAPGMVLFELPAISLAFPTTVFDFYVETAMVLRIAPNVADEIHNIGNGVGKYVEASAKGVHMRITYHDTDGWLFDTNDVSAITAEV